MHVTSQNIDGGATEADGGASAPVGPSVATPLAWTCRKHKIYPLYKDKVHCVFYSGCPLIRSREVLLYVLLIS